jgi:hypothetical protein
MDSQHGIDLALLCLIMAYITLFLKETRSGWNSNSKHILYAATAVTFFTSALSIGFYTTLAYILFGVFIVVVCLPFLRLFLERLRNR